MARKQVPSNNPQVNPVDEFVKALDHPLAPVLQELRAIIAGASPDIAEGIKWNSPSFFLREGAKDFATLNIHPRNKPDQSVLVIFHQGAKVKDAASPRPVIDDPAGLLQWLGKERCSAKFPDLSAAQAGREHLQSIVRQWIGQL